MNSAIIKGFLIGSSFGFLAAILGFTESVPRSIVLGSLCGIFAGITMNYRIKRQQKNDDKK